MSDTPKTARVFAVAVTQPVEDAHKLWAGWAEKLERQLAAVTAERDALRAVVNTLAEKRWFLDHVGAECTFEGSPMVQIGHLEELVEMAEAALRGKEGA